MAATVPFVMQTSMCEHQTPALSGRTALPTEVLAAASLPSVVVRRVEQAASWARDQRQDDYRQLQGRTVLYHPLSPAAIIIKVCLSVHLFACLCLSVCLSVLVNFVLVLDVNTSKSA